MFSRLTPAGEPVSAPDALDEIRFHDRAPAGRPYVFMNFVSTVDGRAAVDGHTAALGSAADLDMLLSLRAAADGVLIGSGTLRAEGYARLVGNEERRARREAAGLAADPTAVLISRGLDLPWTAGLFKAPDQPVIVYTQSDKDAPEVAAPVEVVRLEDATPAAALADLRRRGMRALLSEGGPRLHRSLLAAGLVDELFLTITPLLTGDELEPNIVAGGKLAEPIRLDLEWLLGAGPELFARYVIRS
ncbi:MAG TPA: dihydrofolate reductase family protein [Solirubrobacteraceae bacterium]